MRSITCSARIPLRSPFGPLRLILKSLITPADAARKARGLLAMIPAGSMFAAARAAAEAALADDPAVLLAHWSLLRPAQQAFVAETRGLPPTATALLDQITEAERRGPAALFTLLVKPGLPLPADELRTACLDLLPAIPEYLKQFDRRFEPLSEMEHDRVLALAAESQRRLAAGPGPLGRRGRGPVAAADAGSAAVTSGGAASPGRSGAADTRRSAVTRGRTRSRTISSAVLRLIPITCLRRLP